MHKPSQELGSYATVRQDKKTCFASGGPERSSCQPQVDQLEVPTNARAFQNRALDSGFPESLTLKNWVAKKKQVHGPCPPFSIVERCQKGFSVACGTKSNRTWQSSVLLISIVLRLSVRLPHVAGTMLPTLGLAKITKSNIRSWLGRSRTNIELPRIGVWLICMAFYSESRKGLFEVDIHVDRV